MNRKEDYIGVFDSGVGGISVLRQLRKLMPGEKFVYFGDSANAPYGTRPQKEVEALSLAAADRLMDYPLKALVVACNTATASAISVLRQAYPELIVIGIEPAVKVAADRFPGCGVGVMATPVTLAGQKLRDLLQKVRGRCRFFLIPAPGLVELVEQGRANSPESRALLSEILGPYVGKIQALVLGCTHYPFAADTIASVLGPQTVLLDGGEGTARETLRRLEEAGLTSQSPLGSVEFLNSASNQQILDLCRELSGL